MDAELDKSKNKQSGVPQTAHLSSLPHAIERRSTARFRCVGSAQVRRVDGSFYSWGAVTDISLQGCYLEMPTVFAVGTNLSLQIELVSFRLILSGEVRVASPMKGMGILFRNLTQADIQELTEIIDLIKSNASALPKPEVNATELPEVADANQAIAALRDFFTFRDLLTKSEFVQILTKSTFAATPSPGVEVANSSDSGNLPVNAKAMGRGCGG